MIVCTRHSCDHKREKVWPKTAQKANQCLNTTIKTINNPAAHQGLQHHRSHTHSKYHMTPQKATTITLQFASFANRFGNALRGIYAVFGGCVMRVVNTYAPGACLKILASRMISFVWNAICNYHRKTRKKIVVFTPLFYFWYHTQYIPWAGNLHLDTLLKLTCFCFSHKNTKYLPGLPQTVSVPLCPAFFDKKYIYIPWNKHVFQPKEKRNWNGTTWASTTEPHSYI